MVAIPTNHRLILRPHRPSAGDGETGTDHRIEEGLPAGAGGAFLAIALRLLEGVVDGDRKGRVRLLGEAVHRLRHAVKEERLRLLLAAVAIRRGNQFFGLGHGERGEEVGEDGLQRAAQPDIEEVRQVGVADVVVVGRIGGNDAVGRDLSVLQHPPDPRFHPWQVDYFPLSSLRLSTMPRKSPPAPAKGLASAKSQTIGSACRPNAWS